MRLKETASCSFATTLEINCGNCDEVEEKNRKRMSNLTQKVDKMKITTKAEREERRTVQLKRNYLRKQHDEKYLPRRVSRQVQPVRLKKISSRDRIRRKSEIMDFEINARAMMAAYYYGTCGEGISNIGSFLGVPSGKSWERSFSRHSPKMCKLILSIVDEIIDNSLKEEIIATIDEKLASTMSKDEIKKATKAWFDKDNENIPDEIKKLGIAVSYDMGWQKRSTVKVFNSM